MYNVEMINKDKIEGRFDFIDENISSLKEALEFSFNHLDQKIDNKTDGLSQRIGDLASGTERQFSMMNIRFDDVSNKFSEVNERMNEIQGSIDSLGTSYILLSEDVRSLGSLRGSIKELDEKFTPLLGLLVLLDKKA